MSRRRFGLSMSIACLLSSTGASGESPYRGHVDITASMNGIFCRHFHDYWSDVVINGDPFGAHNSVSWVECKLEGKNLFHRPSPPFMHLAFDGINLAGISKISYKNDVQYAVLNMSGEPILYGHVATHELCFTEIAWHQRGSLLGFDIKHWNRLVNRQYGVVYFDFGSALYREARPWTDFIETWSAYICPSHLMLSASSSANFVTWYDENKPDIEIGYALKTPYYISVRGVDGRTVFVP